MSILTKVFVVMVTITAIVLVALVVPFVANRENYEQLLQQERDARQAAEIAASMRQKEIQTLLSQHLARETALMDTNKTLREKINQMTNEYDSLLASNKELNTKIESLESDTKRLSAAVEQSNTLATALQNELQQRRIDMVDLKTQIIQQTDRINELLSVREQLETQVRRLREAMVALAAEKEDLVERIASLPRKVREEHFGAEPVLPPWVPDYEIDGQVTMVRDEAGRTFVQVNVGSNDKVKERMKFVVYRGSTFLGELVISKVDEQSSSGMMSLIRNAAQIREGDLVRTGPAFRS